MKKILLSLAMLLTLGSSATVSAQRHRHTPRTETVAKDSAKSKNEGIEAYSDTSSVATADSAVYDTTVPVTDSDSFDQSDFDNPFSWFAHLSSTSFSGVAFIIVVLLMFILLLMPLIIVLLIIRYFIKRHNDRVRLAEKAMETGQMLNDEDMPLRKKSPEYMWQRGIKNVSIGLGLMIFFWFLGAESLAGIGGLIACLGAGQMFMVRYNYNTKFGRKDKDNDDNFNDFNDFNDFNGDISDLKFGDEDKKK